MTAWLLALVPQYGLWLIAAVTFFSCLALPFPASIIMLTAGGFAAAGDLVLWQVLLAAAAGATLGDQIGYWAGRGYGTPFLARLGSDPGREKLLARAQGMLERQGISAIFFSRWLVSPLGPWVNLVAGSMGYAWVRFSIVGVAGESVWAGLYVGAGYAFGGNIEAASSTIGSALGLIAGAAAVSVLGYWLFNSQRAAPSQEQPVTPEQA